MEMMQSQRKMEALCVIITGTQESLWDAVSASKSQVKSEKIEMPLIVGSDTETEVVH